MHEGDLVTGPARFLVQGVRHFDRASEPARRDADATVPEARTVEAVARLPDRTRWDTLGLDCLGIGSRQTGVLPAVHLRLDTRSAEHLGDHQYGGRRFGRPDTPELTWAGRLAQDVCRITSASRCASTIRPTAMSERVRRASVRKRVAASPWPDSGMTKSDAEMICNT